MYIDIRKGKINSLLRQEYIKAINDRILELLVAMDNSDGDLGILKRQWRRCHECIRLAEIGADAGDVL